MREWCSRGLAVSILSPRVYKHELIPLGPSWSDVQKLIAGTESDRPVDIRDRAILLFFSVYGLRSNEVLSLKLEDLNCRPHKKIGLMRNPPSGVRGRF